MSLSKLREVDEKGVTFRSHIDGKKFLLTPETSIMIQETLKSTIIMAFDECTPFPVEKEVAEKSMKLSSQWAERSKASFKGSNGSILFGIQQGGMFKDLREQSARYLNDIGFDGYAIGGLAVGEPQKKMFEVLDYSTDFFPKYRPRYLMGVGKPSDIVGAVLRGVDMFDCVIPTRSGRNGQAFVKNGTINLKNTQYQLDNSPIDEACCCYCCSTLPFTTRILKCPRHKYKVIIWKAHSKLITTNHFGLQISYNCPPQLQGDVVASGIQRQPLALHRANRPAS